MNDSHSDRLVSTALLAAGLAYFAAFTPWTRPVLLDAATWDYMALEVARGLVPYRDIFLHKTPGGAFLGALGVLVGSVLGVEPVIAAHALFLCMGALAPVVLFLLCRPKLGAASASCAAVALLAYDEWAISSLEGCLPKVPTVLFGLISMLAAERRQAFVSGVAGGVSVLCWQPGLAFLIGSFAALTRSSDDGRQQAAWPRRVALLAAGAALPSVVMLVWLATAGALRDFVEQAVLFNVFYIESKARTPYGTLRAVAWLFREWNSIEVLIAPAALLGLAVARPRWPLSHLIAAGVYAAMLFVSLQSWPDLVLLGPAVATALGAGLYGLLRARLRSGAALALTLIVLALAALPDAKTKFHPPITFARQRTALLAVVPELTAQDDVVMVSVPEYLIHAGRRNGWKWPYLWFGVDQFAEAHTAGGFDGMLADLAARNPRVILIGRHWKGPRRARFEIWAAARYSVREARVFPHVRLPLLIYERR
ncbi:MAG: hypothetical protein HY899_11980 [Deltaproteobacteria bacterium]|nr:hypothetical protein [Deltaproteobacteria bacterium]